MPSVKTSFDGGKTGSTISLRQLVMLAISVAMALLAWHQPAIGTPIMLAIALYLLLDAKVADSGAKFDGAE